MGLAWCKVSSLTAAVSRTLKEVRYPSTRSELLKLTSDKTVEGWELNYFLGRALRHGRYEDIRAVMSDLESWLESQG